MDTITQLLERELKARITTELAPHIANIRNTALERIDAVIAELIEQKLKTIDFADGSIPLCKVNIDTLKISKDQILGFKEGNGVEDLAENVQLTVLDDCIVVENTVVAQTVRADTLIVKDVATDQQWYRNLKTEILNEVPVPATPKDWTWEIAEVDAKIDIAVKRQGQLKELEVAGEALLSDVLYTTPGNRRVGINTMEPSDALTVWDNETEIVIGKHKAQEGYIGTRRRQDLNIGANNKVGIVVRSDGSVVIDKLVLNDRAISTGKSIPGTAAKRGDIVLNTQPEQGKYIGWVCLDGIRWAGFGRIE